LHVKEKAFMKVGMKPVQSGIAAIKQAKRMAGKFVPIAYVCTFLTPFVGVFAFFLGATGLTVLCAAVALAIYGLFAIFTEGITWLMLPISLAAGGIGALLAWIFDWSMLGCAALAVCLAIALITVFMLLIFAKLSR
jgi:hypothetical protein